MGQKPYSGLQEIVRYNRHQYLTAVAVIAAGALVATSRRFSPLLRIVAGLVAGGTATLSVGSLAATHWVYDLSKLRTWFWLEGLAGSRPKRWVTLNCGLDDSTTILADRWGPPEAVLDIFDGSVMTEPSIRRARELGNDGKTSIPADFRSLPLDDSSQDLVLAVFSLHELRKKTDRKAVFAEIARSLSLSGRLVLVEHLRDRANFAAFGPGAMHFWPREEWLSLAESAGLFLVGETAVTPFVRGLAFARLA